MKLRNYAAQRSRPAKGARKRRHFPYNPAALPEIVAKTGRKPKPRLMIDHHGQERVVMRMRFESPVQWLASRKDPRTGKPRLEPRETEAAERFNQDYIKAGMRPNVTQGGLIKIDLPHTSRDFTPFLDASEARKRVNAALQTLGEDSDLVLRLCCFYEKLSTVEKEFRLRKGNAKNILKAGLSRLADHYEENLESG